MKKDIEPGKRADGQRQGKLRLAIKSSKWKGRRPRGKDDGGLPQPADPTRPRSGEGGAAAALDFD
jgi:hypothetical protein